MNQFQMDRYWHEIHLKHEMGRYEKWPSKEEVIDSQNAWLDWQERRYEKRKARAIACWYEEANRRKEECLSRNDRLQKREPEGIADLLGRLGQVMGYAGGRQSVSQGSLP